MEKINENKIDFFFLLQNYFAFTVPRKVSEKIILGLVHFLSNQRAFLKGKPQL